MVNPPSLADKVIKAVTQNKYTCLYLMVMITIAVILQVVHSVG